MLGPVSSAGKEAFPVVCLFILLDYFRMVLTFAGSQVMERAHYWYYMLELGFYLSLLLRISVDVRRKVKTD